LQQYEQSNLTKHSKITWAAQCIQ